jgi:glycine/D-amino acid oxidase-like deaminating enzyme
VHVSLFRTAPLTAEQKARLGWAGREGVYTAHEILESYRLTADDRIVGGSKTVRYALDGAMLPEDPATHQVVETAFRMRFPMLADLPVTERWSGPISFALDFLPAWGRRGNLLWAAGCAGHGIALASLGGTALAALACDDAAAAPGRVLWDHGKPPLPPEPLRWLLVQALVQGLAAVDARVDREIERGRA